MAHHRGAVATVAATFLSLANVAHAQPDLLAFHRDNYAITGFTQATEMKLQVSAKYDLWPNETAHAVHFAFTAKALWDIYRPSSPFVETNYNPELFYTFFHHAERAERENGCNFSHERVGIEHESNGEDGARSRSWNRVYVESRFACMAETGAFVTTTLKVWAPPFGTADNPRITHHLGYGELKFDIGAEGRGRWWGDPDVAFIFRKGTNAPLREGSIEIDARWRPSYADFWRFTPFLYAQLFTGFGETLLSYDRSLTAFRVGVGFSDVRPRANTEMF